jgi:hypothetical protein
MADGWEEFRGSSRLTWETARLASKDAYERLCKQEPRTETGRQKPVEKTDAELEEAEKYKIWQ